MNEYKLWRLDHSKPGKLEFEDGLYNYYSITLDGYLLMYAQDMYRKDRLRMYILSDELARYFGFPNMETMAESVHIARWRGKLSAKALRRHIDPFCLK